MSYIVNLFIVPFAILWNWVSGLLALFSLIVIGIKELFGSGGTFKSRIIAKLSSAEGARQVLTLVRSFIPNIVLSKKLFKCYENNGTALVTRYEDVLDVINRNEDFEVVYGSRMQELTGGKNFFLGMQPGWDYTRDTSAMRLAARSSDVEQIILPRVIRQTNNAVDCSNGLIDLPQDVGLLTSVDLVGNYFGTPGPSSSELIEWMNTLFWYLFADLGADPTLHDKILKVVPKFQN